MGEGDRVGVSSEAVLGPPGGSAAARCRAVFLSYASADAVVANQVCEFLESHGVSCWMAPRDVKPGAAYADVIVRAINEASALVLVLSAAAVASEHVSREVERAGSKHKPIVAFRVDAAHLSPELEYFLSRSQWIDVPALGMPAALVKLAEAAGRGSAAAQANLGLGSGGAAGRASINQAVGTARVAKRVMVAAAVVITLGVGGVLAVRFWQSKHGENQAPRVAAVSDKSIAVLPFTDMSEKHDQEYFGDGLAEQVLNELSRIPALKVIGRTSSFRLRDKTGDLRELGKTLGAAYVLEGSVRRSGEQLRVTAQLINTRDGSHLWSQTYDRNPANVLQLQEEIAIEIARKLQLTVTDYFNQQSTTRSPEAFDLFLRGIRDLDLATSESAHRAATEFERASHLDPQFTPAVVGLASAYDELAGNAYMAANEAYPRARFAVEHALAIDPRSADAYAERALIRINYDRDWSGGAADIAKAEELGGSRIAYLPAAKVAGANGDMARAAELFEAQLTTDPLDTESLQDLGWFVYPALGRYDEADAVLHRAHVVDPDYTTVVAYFVGINLVLRNRLNEAAALIDVEKDVAAKETLRAVVEHARGRSRDSDVAMKRAIAAPNRWAWAIARAYAYRGDKSRALEWLDQAAADHESVMWTVRSDPMFRSLAGDEAFRTFLRKINILE